MSAVPAAAAAPSPCTQEPHALPRNSDGRSTGAGCAQGQHLADGQRLAQGAVQRGAEDPCWSCGRNEYLVGGACMSCPWTSPWSAAPVAGSGHLPSCGLWPLFQAGLFWQLAITTGLLAASAVLISCLMSAPLHIVDLRVLSADDDACGSPPTGGSSRRSSSTSSSSGGRVRDHALVITVRSWTNKLPSRAQQWLYGSRKYRVQGTGADIIDFKPELGNTFSIQVRGENRVQLVGPPPQGDPTASQGALVPMGLGRAYASCLVVVSVAFGVAVLLLGVGQHLTTDQLLLGLPLTVGSMVLAWLLLLWWPICLCLTHLLACYENTPLQQAHRDYREQIHCTPYAGPDADHPHRRGVPAGVLWDFFEHYRAFILDRNMHYVVSNIVLPLTESSRTSFADLWGGRTVVHFVSHSWNTPFIDFAEAIRRHAESVAGARWRSQTYWICSFSNNQWAIEAALGTSIVQSAFARVLTGGIVRGMVMVLDADVVPLQRVWCLFELLIATQQNMRVTFATPMGIMGDPSCTSVDVIFAIAERIRSLRVEDCEASNEDDKRQILERIVSDLGSLCHMDSHIRSIMAKAIADVAQHVHARSLSLVAELSGRPPPSPVAQPPASFPATRPMLPWSADAQAAQHVGRTGAVTTTTTTV